MSADILCVQNCGPVPGLVSLNALTNPPDMATNKEILQEIRRLHERLDDIEGQLREMRRENSSDLMPLQALAEELSVGL